MSDLTIIESNGERVLTTQQLAESFGADAKIINRNFQRNSERYIQGKHFIALTGEELREFKGSRQFDDSLKFASVLYLWTEKGAWLHAKSLNTDEAWDAYEMLVDDYYQIKPKVLSEKEQLMASMKLTLETSQELTSVKNDVAELKQVVKEKITLDHGEQMALNHQIKKRIESIADDYATQMNKPKLYSQIHSHLRRAFAVPSYRVVKAKDFEESMNWVKAWRPLI